MSPSNTLTDRSESPEREKEAPESHSKFLLGLNSSLAPSTSRRPKPNAHFLRPCFWTETSGYMKGDFITCSKFVLEC